MRLSDDRAKRSFPSLIGVPVGEDPRRLVGKRGRYGRRNDRAIYSRDRTGEFGVRQSQTMPTIFTIGHSTRTIEEFVALLRQVVVDLLVDVRSIPRSRTNPQFNADALPVGLNKIDPAKLTPGVRSLPGGTLVYPAAEEKEIKA